MLIKFKHTPHLRDEEIVKFIKDNVNIENVVEKLGGLNLVKTGNSLQGNCPTGHTSQGEKCFSINTEKNFYHCFHCGAAGDNINLVELVNSVGFLEALNWFKENFELQLDLTERVREVEKAHKAEDSNFYVKQMMLEEIVKAGHQALFNNHGQDALKYLTDQRKYSVENLKQTEWFFLPPSDRTKNYLIQKYPNYSKQIDDISFNGYYGDNFRLAFPYRDRYGRITGFLKRSLNPTGVDITTSDGKEHKNVRWDSSKGTNKKDLFGIYKCKDEDTLIIVEGYPDALYLPTLGMKNIVAVGQGLLSESHLEALKEFNIKNVIISFDNDPPKEKGELTGVENTVKAVDLLTHKLDINVFVLDPRKLGSYKDPDEYVKAEGVDAFRQLIDNAEFGLKWRAAQLLSAYNLTNPQQHQKALDDVFGYELHITNQIKSLQFLEGASELLKIDVQLLQQQAAGYKQKLQREELKQQADQLLKTSSKQLIDDDLEGFVESATKIISDIRVDLFRSKVSKDQDLAQHLKLKFETEKSRTAELLGYKLNKFKQMATHLDGVQPGFYILSAETNIGKTAVLTNLSVDLLESNPALKLIYLSLDDQKDTIINRLVSMKANLPINVIRRKRTDDSEEKQVYDAYQMLINLSEEKRFNLFDISDVSHIDEVEGLIAQTGNDNLAVMIDGLYNLSVNGDGQGIRVENIARANKIKTLVDTYRIPIICTGEMRKKTAEDSAKKIPTIHDLMETGKFGYNANVVWILSQNSKQDNSAKELNLSLQYAKNKLSDYKGFQELKFIKGKGIVEEVENPLI